MEIISEMTNAWNISPVRDIQMAPRKGAKRQQRKGRARKGRVPRAPRAGRDMATVVARTQAFNITSNKTWEFSNFALTNSQRAIGVAKNYQEYRLARVDITFKPAYDTFQLGNNVGIPVLYGMANKFGTIVLNRTDLYALKQMGAKPRRLDDKTFTISMKPVALLASSDNGTGPGPAPIVETAGVVKVSPWLPTNATAGNYNTAWSPNSIDHRGYVFYIDQPNAPADTFVGQVEVVVHYQFRRPYIEAPAQLDDDAWGVIDVDTMTEAPKPLTEAKSSV